MATSELGLSHERGSDRLRPTPSCFSVWQDYYSRHEFCQRPLSAKLVPSMGQSRPVIAFLVVAPFELLDLTGPASVFQHSPSYEKSNYTIRILSARPGDVVQANGGIFIGADCRFSEYKGPIDTLIAIGGEGAIGPLSPDLLAWLRKRSVNARRVASVCTGAFILAAAGLLEGRRVVTHWRFCDLLTSRYKQMTVERDPIFIKDGKFYTTAGVTAGIDLALALVEEDLGREVGAREDNRSTAPSWPSKRLPAMTACVICPSGRGRTSHVISTCQHSPTQSR